MTLEVSSFLIVLLVVLLKHTIIELQHSNLKNGAIGISRHTKNKVILLCLSNMVVSYHCNMILRGVHVWSQWLKRGMWNIDLVGTIMNKYHCRKLAWSGKVLVYFGHWWDLHINGCVFCRIFVNSYYSHIYFQFLLLFVVDTFLYVYALTFYPWTLKCHAIKWHYLFKDPFSHQIQATKTPV
jgi:hypothetical protein